ncbi:MAG: hypothetical protein WAM82_02785, partial [Thermoanaerobaculia bacterium]
VGQPKAVAQEICDFVVERGAFCKLGWSFGSGRGLMQAERGALLSQCEPRIGKPTPIPHCDGVWGRLR